MRKCGRNTYWNASDEADPSMVSFIGPGRTFEEAWHSACWASSGTNILNIKCVNALWIMNYTLIEELSPTLFAALLFASAAVPNVGMSAAVFPCAAISVSRT